MRRMERKAENSKAGNVPVTMLTVPAGHKYELLTLALSPTLAGNSDFYGSAVTAGWYYGLWSPKAVPQWDTALLDVNTVCLDEGDVLIGICARAGASAWDYYLTYMDVDFNA